MKIINAGGLTFGDGVPKIAVPVVAADEGGVLAQAREAYASGADLVELRADALLCSGDPSAVAGMLGRFREHFPGKALLFTLRSGREGGLRSVSPEDYRALVLAAIGSGGTDLVDVEQECGCAEELVGAAHSAGIPVVLSFHDFSSTPSGEALLARLEAMEGMGADIAKIACMPAGRGDAVRVMGASAMARETLGIPHILISMGEDGRIVRRSAECFGSALVFGCLEGHGSAPGQIEISILRQQLRAFHEARERAGGCVFLTGFMGAGKSAAANELHRRLGREILEMDRAIEEAEGRSIPEIFAQDGEAYFRDLESELIAGLSERPGTLVSCGGGAVLRPGNAAMMRCLGTIVLLTASPETFCGRLAGQASSRPLLAGRCTVEGIAGLLEERRGAYEAAAQVVIHTDGKTVAEVAEEIIRRAM